MSLSTNTTALDRVRRAGPGLRFDRALQSACFALLGAWLALFWSLVLHARLVTGEWPHAQRGSFFRGTFEPASIDPADLPSHFLVLPGLTVAVLVAPLGFALLCLGAVRPPLRRSPGFVLAYLAAGWLVVETVFLDAGGCWSWFLD